MIRQTERLRTKFPLEENAGEWLAYARQVKTIGDVYEAEALKAVHGKNPADDDQLDRITEIKRKKSAARLRAKENGGDTEPEETGEDESE